MDEELNLVAFCSLCQIRLKFLLPVPVLLAELCGRMSLGMKLFLG